MEGGTAAPRDQQAELIATEGAAPAAPAFTRNDEEGGTRDLFLANVRSAFGIVFEALVLFFANAKHFLMIQLTLIFPMISVVLFAVAYIPFTAIAQHIYHRYLLKQPPPPDGYANGYVTPSPSSIDDLCVSMVMWTLLAPFIIFSLVAQALSNSAILHSVKLIYTRQTVTFLDVVRAAILRLWLRLIVTYLYIGVLEYFLFVTFYTIFEQLDVHVAIWILMLFAVVLLAIPVVMCLEIIVRAASCVCILEERYGWVAIKKAIQLLQGNLRWVAVMLQFLWLIPFAKIYEMMTSLIFDPTLSSIVFVARAIGPIVYITIFSQMSALCTGVLYWRFIRSADASYSPDQVASGVDVYSELLG